MRASHFIVWLPACWALLEERFVSFERSNGAVAIHDAAILYAVDDPVGLQIATDSLAADLEEITGKRPRTFAIPRNASTNSGNITTGSNSTGFQNGGGYGDDVIIVATLNSILMKGLVQSKGINIDDVEGKWETFKTIVVDTPLPGVKRGLIIAGSDKRAAMFGVYTLSEQSGQSP